MEKSKKKERDLKKKYTWSVLEQWISQIIKNYVLSIFILCLAQWNPGTIPQALISRQLKTPRLKGSVCILFSYSKSWGMLDKDRSLFLLWNCFLFGVWSPVYSSEYVTVFRKPTVSLPLQGVLKAVSPKSIDFWNFNLHFYVAASRNSYLCF